jgi:hypothetical protein
MANFPGTNIPLSSFKGSDSKKQDLIKRLEQDMANKDIQGMNDAIFDIAYYSVGGQGQGQGNANVSKVHNGTWEVNVDKDWNTTSWAEDNVNSEGDGYIQKGGKKKGKTVEFSDTSGVLVDGVSTGSWGGWDNTEFNRDTGEKNVYFKDDPKVDLPESGVEVDTSGYPTGVTTGNPDWITTGYDPKFVDSKWTDRNVESPSKGTFSKTGSEAINLLDYRPWTKNYWSENISRDKGAQGLLYSALPQQEYGLAYLPGEHRDPGGWHDWVMGGHKGQPPGSGWRTQPSQYKVGADRTHSAVTGEAFPSYFKKGSGVPWQFTAPGSLPGKPRYNIDFSPWNATSMNLSKQQGKDWQGFLSEIDTSPAITPGLLSKTKGGPINFPTAKKAG